MSRILPRALPRLLFPAWLAFMVWANPSPLLLAVACLCGLVSFLVPDRGTLRCGAALVAAIGCLGVVVLLVDGWLRTHPV